MALSSSLASNLAMYRAPKRQRQSGQPVSGTWGHPHVHALMQGLWRAFRARGPLVELPGLADRLERLVCPGLMWGLWTAFQVSPPESSELKELPGASLWPQWLGHPKIAWVL